MASDPVSSRLGRGLGSMVDEVAGIKAGSKPSHSGYMRLPITAIRANIYNRPADQDLCESVRKFGVLQPVLVAREGEQYRLLAGSRRLQASGKAGLADIPAIVIPPDRAGALDVFLEENLNRTDLSEEERALLRDQWMKETGRDEEQAGQRIPGAIFTPSEKTAAASSAPNRTWQYATVTAFLLSIVLIIALIKPREPVVSDEMDPETESMMYKEVVEPNTADTDWMNEFRFPGNLRIAGDHTLTIYHARPSFDIGSAITPSAGIFMYQLAAITLASGMDTVIEITGFGNANDTAHARYRLGLERASVAAHLLQGEGIHEDRIRIHASTKRPVEEQTLKVTIRPQ